MTRERKERERLFAHDLCVGLLYPVLEGESESKRQADRQRETGWMALLLLLNPFSILFLLFQPLFRHVLPAILFLSSVLCSDVAQRGSEWRVFLLSSLPLPLFLSACFTIRFLLPSHHSPTACPVLCSDRQRWREESGWRRRLASQARDSMSVGRKEVVRRRRRQESRLERTLDRETLGHERQLQLPPFTVDDASCSNPCFPCFSLLFTSVSLSPIPSFPSHSSVSLAPSVSLVRFLLLSLSLLVLRWRSLCWRSKYCISALRSRTEQNNEKSCDFGC